MENVENTQAAPAVDAVTAAIQANFDNKVDVRDVKFHFKKVEDKETGETTKRPSVELKLPTPSVEGIIDILKEGGKSLELLLEAVADVVYSRARELVNENEQISQENFPISQLAWAAIANLPKAERRGGGISKETWEEFREDYIAVMPQVTGRSKEKVELAVKLLVNKFNNVKTDKKVVALLKGQLTLYATNSTKAEELAEVIEFLNTKADTLLAADSSNILDALS